MKAALLLLALVAAASETYAELQSQTFDLPSLLIFSSSEYLQRGKHVILSCQIMSGWSGTLHNVSWLKDGARIDSEEANEDYVFDGPTLNVTGTRQQSENEYQCQGALRGVQLSNKQLVNTHLISSPIKLRRARITKFDRVSEIIISAKQGEVARLPCAGLPDVIPGPPVVFFEKEGNPEPFGSQTGDGRFLSSSTGMQIAMVLPSDEGKYYCVVRNAHTKQTRKSPKPVILSVVSVDDVKQAQEKEKADGGGVGAASDASSSSSATVAVPLLVYPTKRVTSPERPLVIDVVARQDVVLECVFSNAKVIWRKFNSSLPPFSQGDDKARIRQQWGNLRIGYISQGDAGIYSCHGRSPFDESPFEEAAARASSELTVFYSVVVHAPTNVHLHLSQNVNDRSWLLSCYAQNLRYEIPMVFVNATPLIDAVDTMGLATSTNFYTNPINVTIVARQTFTGSVQCISRPAMEEAEIYGAGLERGRSMNFYVIGGRMDDDNLILAGPQNATVTQGETAELPCAIKKVLAKFWLKDNHFLRIYTERIYLEKANTLIIRRVQPSDEGWYTCVVEGEQRKQFKASAFLKVAPLTTTTLPTTTTEETADGEDGGDVLRPRKKPELASLSEVRAFVAGSDVRVQWTVQSDQTGAASWPSGAGRVHHFVVQYRPEATPDPAGAWLDAERVEPHVRAATVTDLVPNSRYKFRVVAHREDDSTAASPETDFLTVLLPLREVIPAAPKLLSLEALSPSTIRVTWQHAAAHAKAVAHTFYVAHSSNATIADALLTRVEGDETSAVLAGLAPNTTYQIGVLAENNAGRSALSGVMAERTLDPNAANGVVRLFKSALRELSAAWDSKMIMIITGASLLLLVLLLGCCILCCSVRQRRSKKISKATNGKFLDTSYRIFNEQKVQKSRVIQVNRPFDAGVAMNGLFAVDSIDEAIPLKGNNNDDPPNGDLHFRHDGTLRSVYGGRGGGRDEEDDDDDGDDDAGQHHYGIQQHYGAMLQNADALFGVAPSSGNGGASLSARCFSAETGATHEMLLVPPPPLLLSNGLGGGGCPLMSSMMTSSSDAAPPPPPPLIPPLIGAHCTGQYVIRTDVPLPDTGAPSYYSPAASNDDSGHTRTTTVESPSHFLSAGNSDGGGASNGPSAAGFRSGSSRNSQISSTDGGGAISVGGAITVGGARGFLPLHSFRTAPAGAAAIGPATTSSCASSAVPPLMSTFTNLRKPYS